jgi:hypothetical protein
MRIVDHAVTAVDRQHVLWTSGESHYTVHLRAKANAVTCLTHRCLKGQIRAISHGNVHEGPNEDMQARETLEDELESSQIAEEFSEWMSSLKQGSRYDLSLSYLDDPKAWLRDEDIANICHEIHKDFIRQPWTGFQNLDWFCHYPIPADLIPIKFDRVRDIFYQRQALLVPSVDL